MSALSLAVKTCLHHLNPVAQTTLDDHSNLWAVRESETCKEGSRHYWTARSIASQATITSMSWSSARSIRAPSYHHAHRCADLPSLLWTEGRNSPVDYICCSTVQQTDVPDNLEGRLELRYNISVVIWPSLAECKVCAGCTREALLTDPPGRGSGFRYQLTTNEVLALAGVWVAGPDHPPLSTQASRIIDYHAGRSFTERMCSNSEMISFGPQVQSNRIILHVCL